MKLRPVMPMDWARLYAWRNDPVTREYSIETAFVPLVEHLRWFKSVFSDQTVRLYIAYDESRGTTPVGTGRLDLAKPTLVELSLTVAPEARGQHYATAIIDALRRRAEVDFPKATTLVAKIRQENDRSLRAFANAGFVVRKVDKDGIAELAVLRDPSEA